MTRFIAIGLIVLVMLVPAAQAEEAYDITSCYTGERTLLSATKELTILGYEMKGVSRSNIEGGAFHNWAFQFVGTVKVEAGKAENNFFGKYLSPDGDFIIGEGKSVNGKGTWKFIQGTGKWKGVTGGGENSSVPVKPIIPGITQGCSVATGTYKLPQ